MKKHYQFNASIQGWGGTSVNGGPAPNQLQRLTKVTLTNADCRARHSAQNAQFVFDHKICTFTQAGQGKIFQYATYKNNKYFKYFYIFQEFVKGKTSLLFFINNEIYSIKNITEIAVVLSLQVVILSASFLGIFLVSPFEYQFN